MATDLAPNDNSNEEHLLAVLQMLRTQLSTIHHDINNPVTVLSGNIELMRELAKAIGVENELEDSLHDMEAALSLLNERVDRLMVVRKIVSDAAETLKHKV